MRPRTSTPVIARSLEGTTKQSCFKTRLLRSLRSLAMTAVIMLCAFSLLSPAVVSAAKSVHEALYAEVELLAEAITIIQTDYVTAVEPKKLVYGALKGLVESLDRHSQFLDPNAYSEMQVETRGEFGGIGLEITLSKDGLVTVVTPIDDTPGAEAGLKPNDKLVKIDGQASRGLSLHEAVKKLRGRPGTKVALSVYRETENRMFDVTIPRAVINIRSIKEAKMAANKIGYIRISEFQDNTTRDLKKSLETLEQTASLDGLILDLRNNPGGLLDVAIEVAGAFLPNGKLVLTTKGRVKGQNLEFYAKEEKSHLNYPMVILINGGSASASEIVAGALKDQKRAILMGTKSFGKGSVQTVIPLRDGSALRLTTSLYYTPSGKSIHGEGLEPDVIVEEAPAGPAKEKPAREVPEEMAPKTVGDPVLTRAVDLLKGLKVYKSGS